MAKEEPSELIRARDVRGSGFESWSLPSFDPPSSPASEPPPAPEPSADSAQTLIEDISDQAVKPLTLDELEAIRQDAYNEGFATGEKDGFHSGQLKAKQESDALLSAKLERLEQLMAQLFEPIAEQDQQLEATLVELVGHIVRQVVRRELISDSSQLRQVVRESLKLLPMGAENVRIQVNPQDFELLKALRERNEENWRILEDENLLPGGCKVESEHSQIDASIETRLAQAMKQIFEHQREQKVHPPAADVAVDLSTPDAP
jgi:flagellar assembly protein FliH